MRLFRVWKRTGAGEWMTYDINDGRAGKMFSVTPIYMKQELGKVQEVVNLLNRTQAPNEYKIKEIEIQT